MYVPSIFLNVDRQSVICESKPNQHILQAKFLRAVDCKDATRFYISTHTKFYDA